MLSLEKRIELYSNGNPRAIIPAVYGIPIGRRVEFDRTGVYGGNKQWCIHCNISDNDMPGSVVLEQSVWTIVNKFHVHDSTRIIVYHLVSERGVNVFTNQDYIKEVKNA